MRRYTPAMTRVIVFDDGKGMLGPLTDLRSAMAIRTGAMTTLERIAEFAAIELGGSIAGVFVPGPLAALTREWTDVPVNDDSALTDSGDRGFSAGTAKSATNAKRSRTERGRKAKNSLKSAAEARDSGDILLINGRCVLPGAAIRDLQAGCALVAAGGGVVGARLAPAAARTFLRSLSLPSGVSAGTIAEAAMLERPWDVIRFRDRALDIDLQLIALRETQELPDGVIGIGDDNIWIHPEATIYPGVTLDAEAGRIAIDAGAVVRPGAVVVGPAYVGQASTVIDRSLIKGHTSVGPVCKVAGEVGGTIFQGFSNKAHDGHLGDSFVGEWVNFGAGTTNSNLLNTYGEVVAVAGRGMSHERTGLQYLGCIVGDHVKFAIGTRIMTGSVFATGGMFAATAPPPAATGRFEWHTDRGVQAYRMDKFLGVARTVMARRNLDMSAAYEARLRTLASATG